MSYILGFDWGRDPVTVPSVASCTTVEHLIDYAIANYGAPETVRITHGDRLLQAGVSLPPAPGPLVCVSKGCDPPSETQEESDPTPETRATVLERRSEHLWKEREFTDAVVICEDVRFEIHRAILAAASPVFQRAWSTGLQEATAKEYTIRDSTPKAVETMLRHCYTGELVIEDDSVLVPLYELATMYEISELGDLAADAMLTEITQENVAERGRVLKQRRGAQWSKFIDMVKSDRDLLEAAF